MPSFLNDSLLKKALNNSKLLYLGLLIIAYLSRAAILGNPFIFFDEEFYLFVGGRMLHGDLPYVDVWDRKPIGIFLIYEFFHLFGPYRIWAYQIGALLSAWLTSIFCFKIARFIAPIGGAFCAGCLYLIWTVKFDGLGGQTPIFYNTLTAAAVFLVVRSLTNNNPTPVRFLGIWIMMIFGIAIQIKPTVIFEGIYIGLFLLLIDYKKNKNIFRNFENAILWCFIAILPTLIVAIFYAYIHHFHEWWFANVDSIFLKKNTSYKNITQFWDQSHWAVQIFLAFLTVLCLRLFFKSTQPASLSSRFLAGWAGSALLGYYVFGSFDKHYALPLLPPLFVNAAAIWQKRSSFSFYHRTLPIGHFFLTGIIIWGLVQAISNTKHIRQHGTLHDLTIISKILSSPYGCIFNFHGPDILLDVVPYCPLTHLPFSGHLASAAEKDALPVDPSSETRRILAQQPMYIITDYNPYDTNTNAETNKIVQDQLCKNYHKIYHHMQKDKIENIIIFKKIKNSSFPP